MERALASTHTDPQVLILRLRWVPFIDITGLQALEDLCANLEQALTRLGDLAA